DCASYLVTRRFCFVVNSKDVSFSDPFCSILFLLSSVRTLFPYTTLFRSSALVRGSCFRRDSSTCHSDSGYANRQLSSPLVTMNRDRKSTRLNSSHVKISYAVFCLKKKIVSTVRMANVKKSTMTIGATWVT